MSKWLQHTIELIVACVVLIGVAIIYNSGDINNFTSYHVHHSVSQSVLHSPSLATPTVYIHGLGGSARSTDHLINVASKTDGQRAITANVLPNGKVQFRGRITPNMRYPLVQVNFLNNEAPVRVQSMWLRSVLTQMKSRCHIDDYNAIAHSAGAVTVLETTDLFGRDRQMPKLKKFASIGGPYDGVIGMNDRDNANSVNHQGKPRIQRPGNHWYPSYRQLDQETRAFPRHVGVLNIYGNISPRFDSDQYVSTASARSLKYLLRHRSDSYQSIQIRGRYAQHSLLHHNSVVDRVVDRFIFNE